VDDLVLAFDEDEQRHRIVRIVSIEEAGGPQPKGIFYETHIYGAYQQQGLHDSKYLPAYVDPKDNKLLFTAKPMPRHEAWRWQVVPADVCSQPFAQLQRCKVPLDVRFQCRHDHRVQCCPTSGWTLYSALTEMAGARGLHHAASISGLVNNNFPLHFNHF
jgi:hypothetical protein